MSASPSMARLRQIELLQDVDPKTRGRSSTPRSYELAPEDVLIECGAVAPKLHFILDGTMAVRPRAPPPRMWPSYRGESVGELSILDGTPPSAWVVATTEAMTLTWRRPRGSHPRDHGLSGAAAQAR